MWLEVHRLFWVTYISLHEKGVDKARAARPGDQSILESSGRGIIARFFSVPGGQGKDRV